MSAHFNIQINIQRVDRDDPAPSVAARRRYQNDEEPTRATKTTTEVVAIKVTADSEQEAFSKARKMLAAAEPEWPEPEQHLHRASCDDSGGNLVCGFPPGPTIAGGRR